jgi:Flp pilus assembly pilin Flp
MKSMLQLAMQFARATRGVTAIEYALIAMLIGVALIGSIFTFGGQLFEVFNQAGNALANN